MKYNNLVLGGTFDHFHKGHASLIEKALELSDCISLGLATDDLYQSKVFPESIESYIDRKSAIEEFVTSKKFVGSFDIIPLFDIYGTTLTDPTFEAIVITEETKKNAELINKKRIEKGYASMELIMVPYETGEDGKKITSERIRTGEIDREGVVYDTVFATDLKLPSSLREKLREPLGGVFRGEEENLDLAARALTEQILKLNPTVTVTVGDISTQSLQAVGFQSDLAIVDNRSRRKDIVEATKTGGIINKPGTISKEAVRGIKYKITDVINNKKKSTLFISGEEDLLALPSILLAPLNSAVIYGQYDLGLIVVSVSEEEKKTIKKLLFAFEI